jgi:hypothetical protein
MKRAAGLEVFASFFKLHTATDHIDNIDAVKEVIYKCLWYQSSHFCPEKLLTLHYSVTGYGRK